MDEGVRKTSGFSRKPTLREPFNHIFSKLVEDSEDMRAGLKPLAAGELDVNPL